MRVSLFELIDLKQSLREKIKELIDSEKARRDAHSFRKPRPCGLTIHVGVGCPNRCIYCYIGDMGFKFGFTEPYPLSGLEITYSLLVNEYFVPSRIGTFIAIGSVTEPLAERLVKKTIDYMSAFSKFLENPIQFSTKMVVSDEVISILKKISTRISPLITIITLRMHRLLESGASSVYDRLNFIKKLRIHGFKPMLFLRPIIPGLIEEELEDILIEAKRYGAVGVVAGSLRITSSIMKRLKSVGIDTSKIMKRVRGVKVEKSRQLTVNCRDLKLMVKEFCELNKLAFFNSACCANAYVNEVPCTALCYLKNLCTNCSNQCLKKLPEVCEDELIEFIKDRTGFRVNVSISNNVIYISGVKSLPSSLKIFLETSTRRILKVSRRL